MLLIYNNVNLVDRVHKNVRRIGAGAANAGSFGGSRQAILEAEQMRNQGMRGDDIQAKGMNQAYAQAQQAMSQADARGSTRCWYVWTNGNTSSCSKI